MGQNAPAALEEDTVIQDKNQEKEQPQKSIFCRQCGHIITSHSLAVQPHENTFRNPAGYSFHVLSFSDAPGAAEVGDATEFATWFSGYAWSYALCQKCKAHIGWWFSGKDSFVGLIATRLVR